MNRLQELILKHPFFKGLTANDIELLFENISTKSYGKGAPIFRRGEEGSAFYMIASGKVSFYLTKKYEDNSEELQDINESTFLESYAEGECFGEIALFSKTVARTLTAVAAEDCTLYELKKESFDSFLLENPSIALRMLSTMANRISESRDQTEEKRSDAERMLKFARMASHEIQNPLLAIYSSLTLATMDSDIEEMKSNIKISMSEIKRLSSLLDRLLSFTGDLELNEASLFSLDSLISEVISLLHPLLSDYELSLDLQLNTPQKGMFDRDTLSQILHNLISNVIKYGKSGKYLGIYTESVEDTFIIRVIDKGPGVPKEKRDEIFHYRKRLKFEKKIGGHGIGLHLACLQAQLHGGSIVAEEVDEGASFKWTIKEISGE